MTGRNPYTFLLFFVALLLPAVMSAQDAADEYRVIFKFRDGSDIFYVPFGGNGARLDSLCRVLADTAPADGSIRVDGYAPAKELARTRCNRVKSELILRAGIREAHFTTTNHTGTYEGMRDVVVITLPAAVPAAQTPAQAQVRQEPERQPATPDRQPAKGDPQPVQTGGDESAPAREQAAQLPAETAPQTATGHRLALRANLLRWATLTPDLGVEWRIGSDWGILVGGSWTSWSWNDRDRRYALWEVMPEVRRYIGRARRGYIGAQFKAGSFNYKLSATGRQGDIIGGGITGGYLLRLNKALSLDFSLGVGCIHAGYDRYNVTDGVRVYRDSDSKNRWGITHAGVTLVWNIF